MSRVQGSPHAVLCTAHPLRCSEANTSRSATRPECFTRTTGVPCSTASRAVSSVPGPPSITTQHNLMRCCSAPPPSHYEYSTERAFVRHAGAFLNR